MAVPSDYSNLTGWFDDTGCYKADNTTLCANGDACYYWRNRATSSNIGFYTVSTYYTGIQNGLASLYFNEGAYMVAGLATSYLTSSAGTVFVVAKDLTHSTPSYSGYGHWYVSSSGYAGAACDSLGGTVGARGYYYDIGYTARIATKAGTSLNTWGISTWMLNVGTGIYAGWNDTRSASLASDTTNGNMYPMHYDPSNTHLYVGYQAGIFFKGYIGEVVTYSRALSESERMGVEGYLAGKWGISVPYVGGSFVVIS